MRKAALPDELGDRHLIRGGRLLRQEGELLRDGLSRQRRDRHAFDIGSSLRRLDQSGKGLKRRALS